MPQTDTPLTPDLLIRTEKLTLVRGGYPVVDRLDLQLSRRECRELATIISWNLWQMDGLRFVPPGYPADDDLLDNPKPAHCRILDWSDSRRPKPVFVRTLFRKG